MAAITGCTTKQLIPNAELKCFWVTSPDTMDSADTIDLSSLTAAGSDTINTIYYVSAYDVTSADAVTTTWSGTTVTVDAAGGTTNHVYRLFVVGKG